MGRYRVTASARLESHVGAGLGLAEPGSRAGSAVWTDQCGRDGGRVGLVGQPENSVRQRLREGCYAAPDKAGSRRGVARRQLAGETCFAPLLRWMLQWWAASEEHPRRLALALNASTLEARVTALALSVVYRGCAIPVAWVVARAQEPGAWQPHWRWLLRQAQQSIPADWLVNVLGDRGLYALWLYRAIVADGWHRFLRMNAGPDNGRYRLPAGGGWRRLAGAGAGDAAAPDGGRVDRSGL